MEDTFAAASAASKAAKEAARAASRLAKEEALPLFSSISASFASFRGGRLGRVVAVVSLQEELRSAVCWVLELLGCLRVLSCAAVDALAILAESVDLVLCDLDLAGSLLQGFQAGVAVEPRPIPPVVLICEKRMDRKKVSSCLDGGAMGYVAKPLRIQAIRGVVVRHANGAAPETPAEVDGESGPCDKRYEKVRMLGRGGFGEVFLVRRHRDGAHFAMKELSTERLSAVEQLRVLEELRLHRAFDCPCVVRYYTSWMQDDAAFLLLEFVENGSLSNQVSKCLEAHTELADALIVDWAGQIIVGLLYLHRKEVVHRDLKLDNVLGPTDLSRVKLADFGISKRLSGALAKSLIGTPEIMAPERCIDSAEAEFEGYGPESDLWSLGVVLYELATLRPPFAADTSPHGEAMSAGQQREKLFCRIRSEEPAPLPFSRAAVLHKVVTGGLLRKRPQDRPGVSDLVRDPELGSAIHQFLRRSNLLEHPSILEVLDVLPASGMAGSRIESSDLDVVTLHSHDARGFISLKSKLGSLQASHASTGQFLDKSRLPPEELASLFGGVPTPLASHVPAGPKRMEALSETPLEASPTGATDHECGSESLIVSADDRDASNRARVMPGKRMHISHKEDERVSDNLTAVARDIGVELEATPLHIDGADSGGGGSSRASGELPPRADKLAPLALRPQLDAASEADTTDSARRRRLPPTGNYHTHPQRDPRLLIGACGTSEFDRLGLSPCSSQTGNSLVAVDRVRPGRSIHFKNDRKPEGNRSSSADPLGAADRSNSKRAVTRCLQPLPDRPADPALRPSSSEFDLRETSATYHDDGLQGSSRCAVRRRATSVTSLPSLGEIGGGHLALPEPDGANSSASSSSRARRRRLAPMGSSSDTSLHAAVASRRTSSVPRLALPVKDSTPGIASPGGPASGGMTPPLMRNGSGRRLCHAQALQRGGDDAGSGRRAAEARARGDPLPRSSASPGPSAGRSGSRGPPLASSQGSSQATVERAALNTSPQTTMLERSLMVPPTVPRGMNKCKSDAALVRPDSMAGRANGSAVRSRNGFDAQMVAGAAAGEKPRRRPSKTERDAVEPTIAWAGSMKATAFAPEIS